MQPLRLSPEIVCSINPKLTLMMHSFIKETILRDSMCNDTQFICRCDEWFGEYFQLEDHIVSHANLGDDGHRYFAKCVGPNCRIVHV